MSAERVALCSPLTLCFTLLNSIFNQIGEIGIGAIIFLFWVGGMIVGGDYLSKNIG